MSYAHSIIRRPPLKCSRYFTNTWPIYAEGWQGHEKGRRVVKENGYNHTVCTCQHHYSSRVTVLPEYEAASLGWIFPTFQNKTGPLWLIKTSAADSPVTRRHIQGEWRPRLVRSEDLRIRIIVVVKADSGHGHGDWCPWRVYRACACAWTT